MKKTNNKGFSLVELIIVIAIMVILVAVIAPQYLKFVNNSKVSTDVQTASDMVTAIDVAIADNQKPFTGTEPYTSLNYDCGFGKSLPASKFGSGYSFEIYGNNDDGVTKINLVHGTDKYECYPNPESGIAADSPSGLKK